MISILCIHFVSINQANFEMISSTLWVLYHNNNDSDSNPSNNGFMLSDFIHYKRKTTSNIESIHRFSTLRTLVLRKKLKYAHDLFIIHRRNFFVLGFVLDRSKIQELFWYPYQVCCCNSALMCLFFYCCLLRGNGDFLVPSPRMIQRHNIETKKNKLLLRITSHDSDRRQDKKNTFLTLTIHVFRFWNR